MRLAFSFLLLVLSLAGNAQQYQFSNYSVGDGLAQSQVFAMVEDARGYLWMGTRGGGLSRFDGRNFTTFTTQHGLAHNYILALFEASDGRLWVGTNNGLSIYNGLHFENHLVDNAQPLSVGGFAQDAEGNIWIGTGRGVVRYDGSAFENRTETANYPKGHIGAVFSDRDQNVYLGHNRGFSKVTEAGLQTTTRKQGLNNHLLAAATQDSTGNIWLGTYGNGLNIISDSGIQSWRNSAGLGDGLILSMLTDARGNVWMATQDMGVLLWDARDSTITNLTESDGLCNNHVRCMLEDSWGNLWFGSSGGGVSRYSGQRFVHHDRSTGLPGDYVYSVFEDHAGQLWTGNSGMGVSLLDSSGWVRYGQDSGFKDVKVKVIFEDRNCNLWLGTEGQGVARWGDSTFTFFNGTNGLSNNWIRDIVEDGYGNLFVATSGGGITVLEPNDSAFSGYIPTHLGSQFGLPQTRVNCLYLDKQERIWFGTPAKGLGYLTYNRQLKLWDETNGLPDNRIRSMVADKAGNLWIGTGGGGVLKMPLYADTIGFESVDVEAGLTSGNVYLLELDDEHNLWAGTESGVDRLALDSAGNVLEIKHFGAAEGFVGIETAQNAVCKDRQGNVWFGTIAGLTMLRPGKGEKNLRAPTTSLTNIRLFYEPMQQTSYGAWMQDWGQLKPGLQLPYDRNHLSFDFLGIDLKNPQKVRYQWRLVGSEEDWSPVTEKSDATYSNLAPGSYTFEVRAMNEDGVWTAEPQTASFTILPPFWQTWWFIALCIAAGLAIIALIFRVRLAQLRRERKALTLEKDLLALEQKALRLQMNPHFIFNALNSIQALITLKDEKTARYFLAKFSKLMRNILENSRESVISIESEVATLDSYLSLERFSRNEAFDFSIEVDEVLDAEGINIPPMMIQPFVENAIIHGVAHLSERKGQITVRFYQSGSTGLMCEVSDNGIGRTKAKSISSQVAHGHKSTALVVTQERLDLLNAGSTNGPSLEITDVEADGSGTRVVLQLPLL